MTQIPPPCCSQAGYSVCSPPAPLPLCTLTPCFRPSFWALPCSAGSPSVVAVGPWTLWSKGGNTVEVAGKSGVRGQGSLRRTWERSHPPHRCQVGREHWGCREGCGGGTGRRDAACLTSPWVKGALPCPGAPEPMRCCVAGSRLEAETRR